MAKVAAVTKESNRIYSPLFPFNGDADEREVFADEICRIEVSRLMPSATRLARRVTISENEFTDTATGEVLVINPETTKEADLQRFFGGGEYFLQAYSEKNQIIAGRTVFLGGPPKSEYLKKRKAMFGVEPEEEASPDPVSALVKMNNELQKTNVEAAKSSLEAQLRYAENTMQMFADRTTNTARGSDGMADLLRTQLEQMSRDNREELKRREKEIDDLRDRQREDLKRRDLEYADLRRKFEEDISEYKKRAERELDDMRKRCDRDVAYEVDRSERRIKDLDRELYEKNKRLAELEKETIGLTRDLAAIPEAPSDPSTNPNDPPWLRYLPQALNVVDRVTKARVPDAPAIPQPAQVQQRQAPMPSMQTFNQPPAPRSMPVPQPVPQPPQRTTFENVTSFVTTATTDANNDELTETEETE